MRKYSLLYIGLALVVLVGTVHFTAEAFYLYWTIGWLDNLTHFLAGLAGGSIAVWFLFDSGIFYKRQPTVFESVLGAFLCLMAVGIAWEFFEYVNGLTQSTEGYVLDTIHDLLSDAAGATLAGLVGVREMFRTNN